MQTMYCRGVCNENIRNKGARNKGVRSKGVRDQGVRRNPHDRLVLGSAVGVVTRPSHRRGQRQAVVQGPCGDRKKQSVHCSALRGKRPESSWPRLVLGTPSYGNFAKIQ